jgi:hypothetical protein
MSLDVLLSWRFPCDARHRCRQAAMRQEDWPHAAAERIGLRVQENPPAGRFLGRALCRVTLGFDEMHRQRRRAHRSNDDARIVVGINPLTTQCRGIGDTFLEVRDGSR